MKNKNEKPLVVTTAHRGVFFGYGKPTTNKTIRLRDAQMCVYWPTQTKGVVGLASKGPPHGSRIGPPAPFITLQDVTAIMEASEEAAKAWQAQPWS